MSNLNLKSLKLIVFICVLFCEKCLSHDASETIINRAIKSGENNERVTEKEVWIPKLIPKFYYVDKFDDTITIKNEQSPTFSSDNGNINSTKKRISRQINYGRSSMYSAGSTPYLYQSNYTTYKTPLNYTYNGFSSISNSNNYSVTQKYPHNQFYPTRQYSTSLNYPSQNPVSDRPPYYPDQQNSHSSHSSYPNSNNYYQNTSDHQSSKPSQIVYSQNSLSNNNINDSSPRTLYPFSRSVNISQNTVKYPHNSPVLNGPASSNYANSMNSYHHTNNNTINHAKDTPFMYNRVSNFTNNPWNVPSSNVNTRHESSVPNFMYNSSGPNYPENPTYHNSNYTMYQSHQYPQNSSTYPGYSVHDTNTFSKENLNIIAPKPIDHSKDSSYNMYNRVYNFTNNPWNVPSPNVNNRNENSGPNVYNSSRAYYYPENPTQHNSNHTLYQSHHYPQNRSTYPGYSVHDNNMFNKENLNSTAPRPSHFFPTTSFNSSYSSYPTNKYPTSTLKNDNQNNFSYNNSFQSQRMEPNHFFNTSGNKTAYDPHNNPYNFQYGQPK